MDMVTAIGLTRFCIQITNTVVLPIIHTSKYKEIQNKKHVNSKPKVLSNTMFHISGFRYTDIVEQADSVNN